MALSRTVAIVVTVSAAVLLGGCSDADPAPQSPAVASAPMPAADAGVTWAGGVCSASTDLRTSVAGVGDAVKVDPSASATSLDSVRMQVRDSVTAVQRSAASLDSALSAVPEGADAELATAQQQLRTASRQAQDSVDQLGAAAEQVANAGSAAELAADLPPLKAALTAAADDLAAYGASLRGTINGGEQAVRNAFGAAPACRQVDPTATP
jgi:hypothetical protein